MRNAFAIALLTALVVLPADAARVTRTRVTRHGVTRTRVTVRPASPSIARCPSSSSVPPDTRRAARLSRAGRLHRGGRRHASAVSADWRGRDARARDGWTDFTMDVDRRGGDDAGDRAGRRADQLRRGRVRERRHPGRRLQRHVHRTGTYQLLDFRDGRKVDHVRVVAKADTAATDITLHLIG